MNTVQETRILPSSRTCTACERQLTLRHMKRVLRDGSIDARAALLLSSSVIELEHDPSIDPRAIVALNRGTLLANT